MLDSDMPNKNVLAILAGVVAVGLAALSVFLHGDPLPVLGSTLGAVGLFSWAVTNPARRNALILMALAAGSAALFFHFDNFWGLVTSGLIFVWSAFGMLPLMDGTWRLKLGFVVAVFLAGAVALWPTLHNMSGGKIPLPAYVRDRVNLALAPGLDLRGGIRLVYTVEVEEAIRDKRDRIADEIREDLATAFGAHSGDARVTRDELAKLDEKVPSRSPRARSFVSSSRTWPTSRRSTTASPRSS